MAWSSKGAHGTQRDNSPKGFQVPCLLGGTELQGRKALSKSYANDLGKWVLLWIHETSDSMIVSGISKLPNLERR